MFIVTYQKYRKTESKNSPIIPLPKLATVSILIHTFKTNTGPMLFTEMES